MFAGGSGDAPAVLYCTNFWVIDLLLPKTELKASSPMGLTDVPSSYDGDDHHASLPGVYEEGTSLPDIIDVPSSYHAWR